MSDDPFHLTATLPPMTEFDPNDYDHPPVKQAKPLMRARCSVCSSEFRPHIEALLAAGLSLNAIETKTREFGRAIKRETIAAHLDICLAGKREAGLDTARIHELATSTTPGKQRDFAQLVQSRAIALMEDGLLRVTTRDGLAAQQLLDRREEKAEDRKFMLNLARLLSGGGAMAPEALIEGDYVDVTPALEAEASSLYAPAHLRED